MSTGAVPADEGRVDRGVLLALGAMVLGVFVVANDVTALSVALPDIEADFDSDVTTVQWVINGYALVFGVLIVTGGRLADLLGRREVFIVGAAIFAAFSVLGAAAQDDIWLIATRALMGIGGALMWPAVLGMTYALLPAAKAGLAGGLIIGAAGLGNAVGPLLGGALTDALSWRWILLLNLPIAAFAILVTWRYVRLPAVDAGDRRIDYGGIATLSLGLVAFLLALDQISDWGLGDPRIIGLVVVAVALLAGFAVLERRSGDSALVPRDVMRNPDFRAACLAVLCVAASFFAALIYLPQFMQKLLGYSPLEAGLGLLPMMGVFAAVSIVAGPLYERVGAKPMVAAGAGCIALGMFLMSLVGADASLGALVPGMVVMGAGIGLFFSSVTTAGVTALDPSRTSLAGGIVYMFQIAGGSIGLGLTTAVFTAVSDSELSTDAAGLPERVTEGQLDAVRGILAGTESATEVHSSFSAGVAERLESLVRESFAAGFDWAFRLDAALALVAFLIAVLFVGGRLRRRAAATEPAGEPSTA